MQKLGKILALLTLLLSNSHAFATNNSKIDAAKKNFINQLVTKDHFNRNTVTNVFKNLHENKEIISRMNTPFEKQSWSRYRGYFITPERVHLGVAYWYLHQDVLNKMQKKYGVPAEIIIAIVGVETAYGLHMGGHSIANTLYTLAFYYPKRATYFRSELRQFFLLTRENHLPILSLKGSYAGALGIPQFMPSSYRRYGVSEGNFQQVDLFHNQADAIASVANYLAKHGWHQNEPVTKKINNENQFGDKKIHVFKENNTQETWRLYHNFDVILSYNHSASYAMVVYQLAQAIKKQYVTNKHQKTSSLAASTRKIGFS